METTLWVPFLDVASQSVATVAACAIVGVYGRRTGVLRESALRVLDKLISSIYLPCLIFKQVLPNVSLGQLLDIWPLAVVCVTSVIYGLMAGAMIGRDLPRFRPMLMVAIAFPNSFSVPLTLMLALGDLPVLLSTGEKGGAALQSRINFLFLMSYSLWTLARWSIGYPILTGAISMKQWRKKVVNPPVVACLLALALGLTWDFVPEEDKPWLLARLQPAMEPMGTALRYAGQCSVPSILMSLGAKVDEAICSLWPQAQPQPKRSERSSSTSSRLLNRDMEAGPSPTNKSASTESQSLVCVRQQLNLSLLTQELPISAYVAVFFLRQVAGPALGLVVVLGLLRGFCGVANPVVLLVGLLQTAGPPMINLAVMSGLDGTAEKEVARLLLLTYSLSVITWTVSIALFLLLL